MPHPPPLRIFRVLRHHPAVEALVEAAHGAPCHLVGGALRDRVLGLHGHDIDAVVAGRGREIGEVLAERLGARLVHLGGKAFAAYRLVGQDWVLDLWDRGDATLHDDLARRDFTVNSIAYELAPGEEVVDPFGGLADLDRRVLAATTPASFEGDPLRVLRLPRLLLQLPGFAADPASLDLARRAAPGLARVAAERVRDELSLLLGLREAHRGLAVLAALDVYPGLWLGAPGEPGGGARGHFAPAATAAIRELEALRPCRQWLRELAADPDGHALEPVVEARTMRLASLFANLPDPPGGPLGALARFRDAGYLTRSDAQDVAALLAWEDLPADDLARRRFVHTTGPLWATAACWLAARAAAHDGDHWAADLDHLVELVRREGEALIDPPRLLSGEEVQELLGIGPGPEVGAALARVREAQVEGRVRTREEAVGLLHMGRPLGLP